MDAATVRYNSSMSSSLASNLLNWYQKNARDLPWRRTSDPYAILVSEIMLQQTRVETVVAYYQRWIERFPDFETLAHAALDDVFSVWEGLGYYRRAQNLRRTAKIIVDQYHSSLPDDIKTLQSLPGIGEYTAAAIAAFVYNQDVLTLDGNLKRVLARVLGLELDLAAAQGKQELLEQARKLLPAGHASDFNQALMDLGAVICLPSSPHCDQCPLKRHCRAFAEGSQDRIPLRKPKQAVPHFHVAAGVIHRGDCVLLARRPAGKLLAGLWEFPGGKQEDGESLPACLQRELAEELDIEVSVGNRIGTYRHAYTHFKVTVTAFTCRVERGEPVAKEHAELAWPAIYRLEKYPMGKVDRMIAVRLAHLLLEKR
ncbi:MAG: A/G-specific adenine glycosylase [Anaerolineales bacterium]|nr:A/G-specific adenine glycosylase [Anaerolineales bacterium]